MRSKIPCLDFQEADPIPCNLHQSFDEEDQDAGLTPVDFQEVKDPLEVVDDCILDDLDADDDEVVEDLAPVDSSILLNEEIGDVIDNDWTKTVTCTFPFNNFVKPFTVPQIARPLYFFHFGYMNFTNSHLIHFSLQPTLIYNNMYDKNFVLGFSESHQLISCLLVVIVVSAWTMICILVISIICRTSLDHIKDPLTRRLKSQNGQIMKKNWGEKYYKILYSR